MSVQKVNQVVVHFCSLTTGSMGPFINYVTLKGGGGGPFSVTLCDREGEWSGRCIYTHGQKIISTVLLALVIYLLGLVVWFWFFLPRCMECRRGLAMGILSVRLSVRLSVKRVDCDKTEESCI